MVIGMSESEGLDLSKVVNLIMENPHLVEEISKLARDSSANETSEGASETPPSAESASTAPTTYRRTDARGQRRSELLAAMKPYLSEERAKAIDSMITIADILGMMGGR